MRISALLVWLLASPVGSGSEDAGALIERCGTRAEVYRCFSEDQRSRMKRLVREASRHATLRAVDLRGHHSRVGTEVHFDSARRASRVLVRWSELEADWELTQSLPDMVTAFELLESRCEGPFVCTSFVTIRLPGAGDD